MLLRSNFSSFPHYFIYIFLTSGVKLHIHLLNVVVQFIVFLTLSTLICRDMDISKCFSESLGIRDNESGLYIYIYIYIYIRARENRKNSQSGPKLRILDRFQTPKNANKSVQQVCALNTIFPKPTNFHVPMMSKKSQTVKSSQTDNVRAPFKCDIMVVKRL